MPWPSGNFPGLHQNCRGQVMMARKIEVPVSLRLSSVFVRAVQSWVLHLIDLFNQILPSSHYAGRKIISHVNQVLFNLALTLVYDFEVCVREVRHFTRKMSDFGEFFI